MEKMVNSAYPYSEAKMKESNVYERFGEFQEEWIAVTPDEKELLAHSPELSAVVRTAREKGIDNPLYVRIPRWNANFTPSCLP